MSIIGERMVELAMQAWKGNYNEIIKLAKLMDIPSNTMVRFFALEVKRTSKLFKCPNCNLQGA